MHGSLIYLLPALFGLAVCGGLHMLGRPFAGDAAWLDWGSAATALALVGALTPVWRRFSTRLRPTTDLSHEARLARTLNEFSRALDLIADVEPLVDEELGKLRQTVRSERLVLMLAVDEDGPFTPQGNRGYDEGLPAGIQIDRTAPLVRWLQVNDTLLVVGQDAGVRDYLGEDDERCLAALGVDVVVPLTATNRLVGLLLLGHPAGFPPAELAFLGQLGARLGLALQNALLLRQSRLRLRRLYRAERLATVGQLAAGAAHEIRNPLTSIRSTIQYLGRDYTGNPSKAALIEELLAEVDRINQIIAALLSFSRPSDPALENLELAQLLRQTLMLVQTTARKARVEIEEDLLDGCIEGDPAQLKQVFLNLFLNAIQAMPQGGCLRVCMRPAGDSRFWVEVCDTGKGIGEEDLERVFDPFFTTKEEGTGLGLAICYGIISRHGGEIDIDSGAGKGTTIRVKL